MHDRVLGLAGVGLYTPVWTTQCNSSKNVGAYSESTMPSPVPGRFGLVLGTMGTFPENIIIRHNLNGSIDFRLLYSVIKTKISS